MQLKLNSFCVYCGEVWTLKSPLFCWCWFPVRCVIFCCHKRWTSDCVKDVSCCRSCVQLVQKTVTEWSIVLLSPQAWWRGSKQKQAYQQRRQYLRDNLPAVIKVKMNCEHTKAGPGHMRINGPAAVGTFLPWQNSVALPHVKLTAYGRWMPQGNRPWKNPMEDS